MVFPRRATVSTVANTRMFTGIYLNLFPEPLTHISCLRGALQGLLAFIHLFTQHLLNIYYNCGKHSPYIEIAHSPMGETDTSINLDGAVWSPVMGSGTGCYSAGPRTAMLRESSRKLRLGDSEG